MLKNLLKIIRLVLKEGKLPAVILLILIITNGALVPINIYLWQQIIDISIHEFRTGGSIAPVLPYILGFIMILSLYNLRELLEQITKTKLTHRLRDNLWIGYT